MPEEADVRTRVCTRLGGRLPAACTRVPLPGCPAVRPGPSLHPDAPHRQAGASEKAPSPTQVGGSAWEPFLFVMLPGASGSVARMSQGLTYPDGVLRILAHSSDRPRLGGHRSATMPLRRNSGRSGTRATAEVEAAALRGASRPPLAA
jgi:hypothetical protein